MATQTPDIHEIFNEAICRDSDEDRLRYVDAACGDNPAVKNRVKKLLQAHCEAGGFLGRGVSIPLPTEVQSVHEQAGDFVGPYKLLERIGEGGFGLVFMAEQAQPVRRIVALKILKPGMDTRQVVARFEAERQALAMMDHPNIARVLDGGETISGRPYFVMELVRGVDMIEFCDQKQFSIRARLELLVDVCHAVQHAHHKGIIHRDLKPSNLMVTMHDGRPVVKVIDFGIAKATGQELTDKTLDTNFAQMIGTPMYMSPEQAQVGKLDIDTRSDIYSLGVLLYELLTGTTPFDRERLHSATYDEIRQIIREEEPPKPSTRLTTLGMAAASTVSANRQCDPVRLRKLFRGDLDWIVMKCLEKERDRRYETVNALAMDLQRYLQDEPVLACPPSTMYRVRKFARRNKVVLATATLVLLSLVAGMSVSIWQAIRATDAEALASGRLTAATEAQAQAVTNLRKANEAINRMLTRVAQERLLNVPQMEPLRRQLLQDAVEFHQEFLTVQGDDPLIRQEAGLAYWRLGSIYQFLGQWSEAERAIRQALAIFEDLSAERSLGIDTRHCVITAYVNLGKLLELTGRHDEAEAFQRRALADAEKLVAEFPDDRKQVLALAACYDGLAETVNTTHPDESRALIFQAINLLESDAGNLEALTIAKLHRGALAYECKRFQEAKEAYQEALGLSERLYSSDPTNRNLRQNIASSWLGLANSLSRLQQLTEAEHGYRQELQFQQKLADDFPHVRGYRIKLVATQSVLGYLYKSQGRFKEAESCFREALSLGRQIATEYSGLPSQAAALPVEYQDLSQTQPYIGRTPEAIQLLSEISGREATTSIFPTKFQHNYAFTLARVELARIVAADGRTDEADAIYQDLVASHERLEAMHDAGQLSRWEVAAAHMTSAALLKSAGRISDAERLYRWTRNHYLVLTAKSPDVPGYREQLACAQTRLGAACNTAGRFEEVEKLYHESLENWQKLSTDFPSNTFYHERAACEHDRLGRLYSSSGRRKESEQAFRGATSQYGQLAMQEGPRKFEFLFAAASSHNNLGEQLNQLGKCNEAMESFRRSLELYGQFPVEWHERTVYRTNVASTQNNLAWLLANGPDPKTRNPAQAVEWGRKAAEVSPASGPIWNTLGAAHFRAGNWSEAVAALEKSIELNKEGDSFNWFFLAMAYCRLDDITKARESYDQAVTWMDKHQPTNAELKRIRAETEELLKLEAVTTKN